MSKRSFEEAIEAAGFNDETTKISKSGLKNVMNQINKSIWGGGLTTLLYTGSAVNSYDSTTGYPSNLTVELSKVIDIDTIIMVDAELIPKPKTATYTKYIMPHGKMSAICKLNVVHGSILGFGTISVNSSNVATFGYSSLQARINSDYRSVDFVAVDAGIYSCTVYVAIVPI